MAHPSDLFNYTSGRWLINDALRHVERSRIFNVPGLCNLAAESVGRSPGDVINFVKLAEGGYNRTFLITMRDGFRLVARIPYPVTVPKNLAVASEVATIDFLRSSGLPVPDIYGYSPVSDNAAETEYIFMQFVKGTKLSDIWNDLGQAEIDSVMRQIVQLESKMMSIAFPAGGSLYYPKDLEKLVGSRGVPLEEGRFCIGPDTSVRLWHGRRSLLDVDRGPYKSATEAFIRPAQKERAYLERFGEPLLPFQRLRREAYKYQKQSPLDHIQNIERYLLIAPSLVPKHPALCRFRVRHPDLQPGNVIVSPSPNSDLQVTCLLDWQHTPILPLCLLAGIPGHFENCNDPDSQSMTPPSLPQNLDELNESEQSRANYIYHSRLLHYHYLKSTEEYNRLHFLVLMYPGNALRRRLFDAAGDPWEGETHALKIALIEAMEAEEWKLIAGKDTPCPLVFDAEDIQETMKIDKELTEADDLRQNLEKGLGIGPDGWVPKDRYEKLKAIGEQMKEDALAAAESPEDRVEIMEHWFFDDFDEEKYL